MIHIIRLLLRLKKYFKINYMYNTSFICTYNLISDTDDDNDLANDLYRSQLLQAFNLNEWDSDKINVLFSFITNKLIHNDKGKLILEKMKHKSILPLEDMELILLFSYDFFYLFHNCLIDLLNKNIISDEKYNLLIHKIENN